MSPKLKTLSKITLVIAFLYLFLLSIALMGAAFKGFGKGFAESLIQTTSNPFVGLVIGILATSIVQSSSTTTSIVVGIVGAGQLSVANAIPIIMGANIGTTVTNTLVSLGHVGRREEFRRAIGAATVHDFFNLICVSIMFPLELVTRSLVGRGFLEGSAGFLAKAFQGAGGFKVTSPVKAITKPVVHFLEEDILVPLFSSPIASHVLMLLISAIFLFLALYYIVKIMRSLIAARAEIVLNNVVAKNGLMALVAGLIFTIMVQSSSITTSLLVPMVAAGILSVETIFPITLGANIGTTSTAVLASFATGNPAGIIIAFVHLLFNTVGVVCIFPIPIFRAIPIRLAYGLGNLAAAKRRYAFAYVLSVFFVVPSVLIFVPKLLK